MPDHTEDYEKFDALYREKAQKIKVLMESEKYKDAYSSDIDEGLKIVTNSVGAAIRITKEPRKPRERTLTFAIFQSIVFIVIMGSKYDSKKWLPRNKGEYLFEGTLDEFALLDLENLILTNLEDYIPI